MDDQQQPLEVLIVIDNSSDFVATSHEKPCDVFSTLSVFVDSCLHWVSKLNSPNVIVAFANQSNEITIKFSKKWSSHFKKFQTFCVPNCQSINDVLREIDSRQMLRNDFILIRNGATFCSSNLERQIEKFRLERRQNKKNVLTLLYYEKLKNERTIDGRVLLIGYNDPTQKLVHYENIRRDGVVSIRKGAFLMDTIFRTDLICCGIALCGIEFSGHFAGNYDFHTFDSIISDILSNEEILMQNIHVDFVDGVCAKPSDSPLAGADNENKMTFDTDACGNASAFSSDPIANLLDEFDIRAEAGDELLLNATAVSVSDCKQNIHSSSSSFAAEVTDSLQGAWEDGCPSGYQQQRLSADLLNKVKLEINASKLAYNIPADEVPILLFSAFLGLPGVVNKYSEFTKLYNYWHGLWKMYYRTTGAQSQMLFAIEEKATNSVLFRRILPKVLFYLSQDVKVLDDALIVDWYNCKLDAKSPLKSEEKLDELVTWLQNAEESSDTDVDGKDTAEPGKGRRTD